MTTAKVKDPSPREEILNVINCSLVVINPLIKEKNDASLTKAWSKRRRIIKVIARIIKNSDNDDE